MYKKPQVVYCQTFCSTFFILCGFCKQEVTSPKENDRYYNKRRCFKKNREGMTLNELLLSGA